MPIRKTPLVTGEVYHILNRGVNYQPIFNSKRDYKRAVEVLNFYITAAPPVRYSKFLLLPKKEQESLLENLQKQPKLVDLICYCFVPKHFHLLLKQNIDNGISSFVRNFQISYTRYYNVKTKRIGHLLQGQFKAVRIENDKQLLHVSRYIHLNPFSSFIVKNLKDIEFYPWSSYQEYSEGSKSEICQKSLIYSMIKSNKKYTEFVLNHADYQRQLECIKHMTFE